MRKERRNTTALAGVILLLAATAVAQEDGGRGFYSDVNLGASFVQSTTVKRSATLGSNQKLNFDVGLRLDVAFGAQFGPLAFDLETGITANSTSRIQDEFGGGDFDFYQIPFLANFYYHIPTRSRLHPFVGVGLGGVGTILENHDLFFGTSDDAFSFGWQGIAGCTYEVWPSIDLGVVYKHLGVTERSFDSLDLKMGITHTHSVTFLVSVKF